MVILRNIELTVDVKDCAASLQEAAAAMSTALNAEYPDATLSIRFGNRGHECYLHFEGDLESRDARRTLGEHYQTVEHIITRVLDAFEEANG